MATINTTDDLVRLLREDQDFREAARRELLPQELLDLPAAHAAFVVEIREFARVTELRLNSLDEKYDRLDANVKRLSDDISFFRGEFAESRAARNALGIAMALFEAKEIDANLDANGASVKALSRDDIRAVARAYGSHNLRAIPMSDRRSFYDSDLIIEVSQENGEIQYIAVEVSNTCNGRDTSRALRHAELLTEFTGKHAWAAIAGARIDNRIQYIIDAEEVFWHPLDEGGIDPR